MPKLDFKKDILPHLLIIIGFIVLSFAYMSPMLSGKVLSQHDITQWEGSYHQIKEFQDRTGDATLWTDAMFSGMPTYQIILPYPNDLFLLKYVQNLLLKFLPHPANSLFIYMLGFYLLLLSFKVDKWLAAAGALAFAFSSYNIIILAAGHATKSWAIGFAPMVLAGARYTLHTRHKLLGMALTGIAVAFEIKVNHVQITYYLFLLLLIFGIVELIYAIRQKHSQNFFISAGILGVAALMGFLTSFTNLALTYEYSKETIRGKSELTQHEKDAKSSGLDYEYAMQYSYEIWETFVLMVPNFHGGASGTALSEESATYEFLKQNQAPNARQIIKQMPTYWGGQLSTSGPVYLGAIICFLFVLGLFVVKGPEKWWLLIASLLAIILSWGKYFPTFNDLFFYYFPFYNKFRTVSMTLVIVQICFPIMALLALNQVFKRKYSQQDIIKYLKWSVYIVGGLLLFFIIFAGGLFEFTGSNDSQLPEWLQKTIVEDRESLLRGDAIRSLVFILLSAAALYFFITEKLKMNITILIIGALILIDMWMVDKRYLDSEHFVTERKNEQSFVKTAADERILQDQGEHYRVLNLTVSPFNDATTSYWHNSIGGYHGAKLRRYQDLISYGISNDIQKLRQGGFQNTHVLNMLDTRYIIAKATADGVMQNPQALGPAWFVDRINWVPNADAEIEAVDSLDPAQVAIIDNRFKDDLKGFSPQPEPQATIELVEYDHNYAKYKTSSTSPQFAVFSEVYYDNGLGWQSSLDGQEKKHVRVDYVLRGMAVPAGEHIIEFRFDPPTYHIAGTIALISSLLLVALLIAGIVVEVRRQPKPVAHEPAA